MLKLLVIAGALLGILHAGERSAATNPIIQKMVSEVSEDRIAQTLRKLESFGTRMVLSPNNEPGRGIGAAQSWLFNELQSYSPRLQVSLDRETAKDVAGTKGDTEIANVVAILPGTTDTDRYILVSGHYDSIALIEKKNARVNLPAGLVKRGMTAAQAEEYLKEYLKRFPPEERQWGPDVDWKATIASPAPGVTDDGSGTATVLELARVFSNYTFAKSIVFIAFSGEEVGLQGSTGYAQKARGQKKKIEAVLNNDIVGSDIGGDGKKANNTIRVFSASPEDSPSRALARYIADTAPRYVPGFNVELVFRPDRFGRGGDHMPFANAGFAAVRFTTPAENFANQHSVTDTFANTSVPFTTRAARVNAAVAASLALAPAPPQVDWYSRPLISRGRSHYDAVLRWEPSRRAAGYQVLIRAASNTNWERAIDVGAVTTYTLPNFSIDDTVLGVRAIDKDGNPSLISAYVPNLRVTADQPVAGSWLERHSAYVLILSALLFIGAAVLYVRSRRLRPSIANVPVDNIPHF
jgi:hypothetical protein